MFIVGSYVSVNVRALTIELPTLHTLRDRDQIVSKHHQTRCTNTKYITNLMKNVKITL